MKQKIENVVEKVESTVLKKGGEVAVDGQREGEEKSDGKNLNQRIEDLVNEMEKSTKIITKVFSLKSSFIRGLMQGLGIVIGSTILAGALYSMTVELFGNDFLKDVVLDDVIKKYSQEK
jgi:hypothetical protein